MKVALVYVRDVPKVYSSLETAFETLETEFELVSFPESLDEVSAKGAERVLSSLSTSDYAIFAVPEERVPPGCLWFLSGYAAGRNRDDYLYIYNPVEVRLPWWLAEAPAGKTAEELEAYFAVNLPKRRSRKIGEAARRELVEAGCALSEEAMAESVTAGNRRHVELYLEAGFTSSAKNAKGIPALTLAVRKNHREIAGMLMAAGADIDLPARDTGNTPVMDAVAAENIDLVREFIDAGAALDVQNKNGQTALILAVGKANGKITDLLLEAGADTDITDNLDMSALKYAELFKYSQLIPLLTRRPA
ncbi:MAG: ankyrin repeat domain-containing protein [Spirochaetia bacterium]